MHHHDHKNIDNVQQVSKKRLGITIFLNFLITVVEIIGGIVSGSLSLISDALHNFSDGIAVILSYFAVKLNEKPKNEKYTFGYKRAEILTAVFNASVLIGISIYLFIEAIDRLSNPSNIDSGLMIWVASIGLVANIAGTLLLKKDASHSLNIKSAYLHLLSDAISSAGVILGGFAIYFYDILWIDPLLTILISAYIIKESYEIVKESITVLMMATPPNISAGEIESRLQEFDEIKNIHHMHIWRINEKDIHFEAHVEVPNVQVSETEKILENIEDVMSKEFGIKHVTIQFECDRCEEKKIV